MRKLTKAEKVWSIHKQDEQAAFEHRRKKSKEESYAVDLEKEGAMEEETAAVFSQKGMDLLFSVVRDIIREEIHEFYGHMVQGMEEGYKRYRQGRYVQGPELESLIRAAIREELKSQTSSTPETPPAQPPKVEPKTDSHIFSEELSNEELERKPKHIQPKSFWEAIVIERLLRQRGALKLTEIQREVEPYLDMGKNYTSKMNRMMKINPRIQRVGRGLYGITK
ncbi:Uncharacterised protein [Mycobacterium tuberculosis]|uniref:Repressor Rok winged helix domain-containing protein n=1 Tax=Kroppenstedtia guangzhouensis TaxID=1274356 RepID=A0ABQ1H6A9_9BACL|nr:hypothetical protein [Kroppenstedtia guangzhouensis]GGA58855.1 hypothetical protein GCM10007416_35010 [Kroppenstedtia guangzhouensis]SGO61683.1 Uncharacterised protein [Mycobacterium tuberculosis]